MPFAAKEDPTFGYMVRSGIQSFSDNYKNIDIEYVYPDKNTSFNAYVKYFSVDCDIIIGAGFMYREAIQNEASRNLLKKYILIDNSLDLPNVMSIVFDDYQAAFLAGAMTGSFFKNWNPGFIGPQDSYLSDKFYYGFQAGLTYSEFKGKIPRLNISRTIVGFVNPQKAYNEADYLFKNGIDVIFAPCGGSAIGVLKAALKNEKYIIGTDRDFSLISEKGVVFSLAKRIDTILYKTLYKIVIEKEFVGGIYNYDLSNGGYEVSNLDGLDRIYGYRKINWVKETIDMLTKK